MSGKTYQLPNIVNPLQPKPLVKKLESDFSSTSSRADSDTDEFVNEMGHNSSNSDNNDMYINPLKNKAKATKIKNPVPMRTMKSRYSENSLKADDSDDDVSYTIRDDEYSSIALRREKRSLSQINYSEENIASLTADESLENLSMSESPLNRESRGLDKIIGMKENSDPPMFYVRLLRSSNADAEYMTKEDIITHPGGNSQLLAWENAQQEYGLKPNKSIPFLLVPGNEEDPPQREFDHIVAYDVSTKLYLVKWVDLPYSDATWEADIEDKAAIEAFRKRERYIPITPKPPMIPFRNYGTGENDIPVPKFKNNNELRSYQLEALNWMRFKYYTNNNAILADEMGLGKTIMCISLLDDIMRNVGIPGPFLIVAPLSTLPNWEREFENWTNIVATKLHGSSSDRDVIKRFEIFYDYPNNNVPKVQVLLTNVETVLKEYEIIQSIRWHFVIIDEAHRLKNQQAKIYKMMCSLSMEHILLMTGTPIQNNLDEIFSLLHFIAPNQFSSLEEFRNKHGQIQTNHSAESVKLFQKELSTYMLRRKKCDVDTSIAGKEETIVEVELTKSQKFYYRLLVDRKATELTSGQSVVRVNELNNLAMQLRKVCNHPFLLDGSEEEIVKEGENPAEAMINSCGKMVFIDKLLPKLQASNTKVLIFSQMVRVLDILEDFLIYRGYSYERLDGRVVGQLRQNSIDRFNDIDSGVFVFLLCTKAGGVGLNLTAASTVIIYDSDWNPQNDVQAQARCHRIGQTHDVKVYRLITRGTYESEMFLRASMKLGLDQAILDSNANNAAQLSTQEIEQLLRKGAYYVFNEDESEIEKFVAEDIDQILERRTKKITHTSADNESMFSKASFVVEKDGEQLDLNDENFWEKVIPKDQKRITRMMDRVQDPILQPRRSKKRFNDIQDESGDDGETDYGIDWNLLRRDKLLYHFQEIGLRPEKLFERLHPNNITLDMINDGCAIILYIITQECDNPAQFLSYLFEDKPFDLNSKQRRLITVEPFSNRRWRESVKKNANSIAERLMSLKALHDWYDSGCPEIRYEEKTSPKPWNGEMDKKLLDGIRKHGWGEWVVISKDTEIWGEKTEWPSKITYHFARRAKFLVDSIMTGAAFQPKPKSCEPLRKIDLADARTLVNLIIECGNNPVKIQTISPFEMDLEEVIPFILSCANIVNTFDSKELAAIVRQALRNYSHDSTVLITILTSYCSRRLTRNTNFFRRLKDYVSRSEFKPELFADVKQATYVPSWWNGPKHDYALIKYVAEEGIYDVLTLLTDNEDFSSNLDETQLNYLKNVIEQKHQKNQPKKIDEPYVFLYKDEQLLNYIDDVIEQTGGWHVAPYVDVPEKYKKGIHLPLQCYGVTLESFGNGEIGMVDGYLYQVGYRLLTRTKTSNLRLSIPSLDQFVIWKSDRKQWVGTSPADVWYQFDQYFEKDPIEAFGLSLPIIQYEFSRVIGLDEPEGYIRPIFEFFDTGEMPDQSTISKKKKKKKPGKKGKKGRRKKSEGESDDDDEDDDEDDDFFQ